MKKRFTNRGKNKMKNIMKIAAFAVNVQGATNRLGSIKSTGYVVTKEDDPSFNSWLGGSEIRIPVDTNNFYIGGIPFSSLMGIENETDPKFNNWRQSSYNLYAGYNSWAGQKAVAIGIPWNIFNDDSDFYISTDGKGVQYYWRKDYMGPVYADRESVAIGDSAQARHPVSVAIGDQAYVGTLHTDYGRTFGLTFDRMEVTTTFSNNVFIVSTNIIEAAFTNWYDIGKYERLPAAGEWKKIVAGDPIADGGVTNTTDLYEQKEVSALPDQSYVTPEDWEMYNRIISGGQGDVDLFNAYYGVAVGSRAYVFGYHSVAYGHYAHASRPFSVAIGSESHVYSEGSQGFGYDTDIPNTSPYSLAIGMNASVDAGLTNAIVIGVPQVVDFTNLAYRADEGKIADRPKAIKSNSINFAFHGNGIQDFFIDGKSLQERIGSEARVVGNTRNEGTVSTESVRSALGLEDDNDIVFASGDGKIRLYTQSYLENSDDGEVHLDEIIINNKTLAEILGSQTPSGGADTEFRTKVMNAAATAQGAVNSATNMVQVKEALNTFFETIKQ